MNAKKLLAILLTLVMLIGMMPVTALAADATSGKCGENATWSYDTASGTLTISGEGKMGGYMLNQKKENTDAPWFGGGNGINAGYGDFSSDIHEIVVEEGITGIGPAAFAGLSYVHTVSLPSTLTAIDDNVFAYCNRLMNITLPDGLTELNLPATLTKIDGPEAFWCANNLQKVNFAGTREVWKAVEMTDSVRTQLEAVIHYGDIVPEVKPTPTPAVNPFEDVSESDWFCAPVMWAVENGITSGLTPDTFGPNNTCTRAQVVTFLYAAAGKPQMDAAESPFTDVMSGDWYLNPVLWAVEKGVTSGLTPDTFGPNNTCTRAQVVTFLYANETK